MRIGYARVSTEDQNLDLQYQALKDAGCDLVFTDKASGAQNDREGLQDALAHCGCGDVLVVWKLDRLGRSLRSLVELVDFLRELSAGLQVLTGHGALIDTTRPDGRMIFGIFAAMAEFERELIRERTRAGMAAARRRGVHVGRPAKLSTQQVRKARRWLERETHSLTEIASLYGVHPSTLRKALGAMRQADSTASDL